MITERQKIPPKNDRAEKRREISRTRGQGELERMLRETEMSETQLWQATCPTVVVDHLCGMASIVRPAGAHGDAKTR